MPFNRNESHDGSERTPGRRSLFDRVKHMLIYYPEQKLPTMIEDYSKLLDPSTTRRQKRQIHERQRSRQVSGAASSEEYQLQHSRRVAFAGALGRLGIVEVSSANMQGHQTEENADGLIMDSGDTE